MRRTADLVSRKPPNPDWLLAMISTMDPNCEIFRKNYVRPKVPRPGLEYDFDDMVSNPEGWFDDLPLATGSKKSKTALSFTTTRPT